MHPLVHFMMDLVLDPVQLLAFKENPAAFAERAELPGEYRSIVVGGSKGELDDILGGKVLDI
jgi:hypothetical protein